MGASLKLSRHNRAQVEYSKLLQNDTIKQFQRGVSTIVTASVHTALQGFYSGNFCWKMGVTPMFMGQMGVACSSIAPESFIFMKTITIRECFLMKWKKLTIHKNFFADFSSHTVNSPGDNWNSKCHLENWLCTSRV